MTISTKLGNLDLSQHVDPQYINQVLAMGSWCTHKGKGYIVRTCSTTKKTLLLHRVVYEFANGPISEGLEIDHIDRNRSNNFLSNLRVVTSQQNKWNRTNAKGCCYDETRQLWLAYIKLNGKMKNLGRFKTESEARQAYMYAKTKYHIINENI